jgi:glucose/arabinose dehydrogenase
MPDPGEALRWLRCLGAVCALVTIPAPGSVPRAAEAPGLRAGFTETVIADSLDSPVSMAIAPDGRVFVCEQGGALRVIRSDRLLPRPFLVVPTAAQEEEGLLGVAFDPQFAHNGYVCATRHSRRVATT